VKPDGTVEFEAAIDQPLRSYDGRQTFCPRPENIVDSAFRSGECNCVVEQLAEKLEMPEPQLVALFHEAAHELYGFGVRGYPFGLDTDDEWKPEHGVTTRMITYVCSQLDWSCHAFWEDRKVLQQTSKKHGPCIAFSFSNGHFWLYDKEGGQALSHWRVSERRSRPEFIPLDHEDFRDGQQTAPNLLLWPDNAVDLPTVGNFYTCFSDALLDARLRLLAHNRCPRIVWRGLTKPQQLIYDRTREEGGGRLRISLRCPEYEYLKYATEALTGSDSYADEPLGSWMCKTVRCLLKGHRNYITSAARAAILAQQSHNCGICGTKFDDDTRPEFDHKTPVASSANQPSELWALCGECRHAKTLGDQTKLRVLTESHMSDEVWAALVETHTQAGLILKLAEPPSTACRYLDKHRCRTSILLKSTHNWPIFLPHDEIKPYTDSLGDFCWVDVPVPETPEEMWTIAPLRGPGWYHRSAVEVALHAGKLDIAYVRWVLSASLHIKADRMGAVVSQVLYSKGLVQDSAAPSHSGENSTWQPNNDNSRWWDTRFFTLV